jgi:tetratricopeptide (TPR) repeat protein
MEDQMRRVRATMINVSGVLECWRNGARALELADRLDGFQLKLHEMSADQIRTTYYAYEGNAAMFERYRQRVEMHAIARGSAWQVEIWAAATSVMLYLRIHDSVGMKRALEQLQRLSVELPSLNVHVRRARGAHLLLRGRHAEAIACLEPCLDEEPRGVAGWGSELAALARAYNGHGEHARAREVCRQALAHLTPLDLTFVGMNLPLQIELALAEAGLGQCALAAEQMDRLLLLHGEQAGPLTLGALYEARTRIALLAGDDRANREYLLKMEHWYRATGIPTLIQRCERLARANARFSARPADAGRSESAELDRVLSEAVSLDECTDRALAVLARTAPELRLYLFLNEPEGPKLVAQIGGAPPAPSLVQEVRERLEATEALEGATEIVDVSETSQEPGRLTLGGTEHQVTVLRAWTSDTEVIVAAAAWWNAEGARTAPPELFQVLATHLHRTRSVVALGSGGNRPSLQSARSESAG